MTPAQPRTLPPYPRYLNAIAILSGIIDPLWGVFIKIVGILWRPPLPKLADTPRRRRRGLTLILGGIEGKSKYNLDMVRGILRSGYRGSVVRFDWNHGVPFWRSLVNLMSRRHHEQQSAAVAEVIRDYKREHPDAPVCMVAQSGGCWIVVRVLERLPKGIRVATAVLLAPAISPGYDIQAAAARCDCELISIGSLGDFFFLGLGTMLLGTSDRVFTPSAGLVGWHHRPTGFVELRWHPSWCRVGYFGNHTTTSSPTFVAAVVGPRLPWRAGYLASAASGKTRGLPTAHDAAAKPHS